MAVYKPKRNGVVSKFYVCEFVYQGKRFQESTGASSRTTAKEYEKRRKAELERAAAGLPTEQKSKRIRTVADVIGPYLEGYKLSHRPKSVLFANGRLAHVRGALGNVVLSDLTDERIRGYIKQRQGDKVSGRTINMEIGELIKHGWEKLRANANVKCRLHDLRHTFATRLAENGVSESTMLALMGHMSRSMLERYSHIRMAAKRDAVAGVTLRQNAPKLEGVPVIVPVGEAIKGIQ